MCKVHGGTASRSKEWLVAGELLGLMGDFNKDMAKPVLKPPFHEVGLVDALASLHGQPT